jgi:hydrogenase expression/formation protein HypD
VKYIDEFRDGASARRLADRIAAEVQPGTAYNFMEFCGGHTHAMARYGITGMLPTPVRMIHGPGCPVCVLPIGRIDMVIRLTREHGVMLCTYGDTLRVPASDGLSLIKAKAQGADIRMVYSATDALALAEQHPQREVVFFAIGFETTTPPTALVLRQARARGIHNFSVLCCHVLTPAAITHLLASAEARALGTVPIDGFIGPAHVSIIIGAQPYEAFARTYRKPVVITGFEPLDVMQGILMLVRQINSGRAEVENEFSRAVTRHGNLAAQQVMAEVLQLRDSFEWRGLGEVAHSGLQIRPEFAQWDAEIKFDLHYTAVPDHKQCDCGAILRGVKQPQDCKLFGSVCTPENPMGACMVSSEGACAAHYSYGRFQNLSGVAA